MSLSRKSDSPFILSTKLLKKHHTTNSLHIFLGIIYYLSMENIDLCRFVAHKQHKNRPTLLLPLIANRALLTC